MLTLGKIGTCFDLRLGVSCNGNSCNKTAEEAIFIGEESRKVIYWISCRVSSQLVPHFVVTVVRASPFSLLFVNHRQSLLADVSNQVIIKWAIVITNNKRDHYRLHQYEITLTKVSHGRDQVAGFAQNFKWEPILNESGRSGNEINRPCCSWLIL